MPKLIAKLIFGLIKLIFRDKTGLVLENLALCHQLSVLKRKKKSKLKSLDRIFWAWLSRICPRMPNLDIIELVGRKGDHRIEHTIAKKHHCHITFCMIWFYISFYFTTFVHVTILIPF